MALQKIMVPVDMTGGLDTKTDEKLTTKLTTLENGVFDTLGVISKRNGYDKLTQDVIGSATDLSSGEALISFEDELLLVSSKKLYSYAPNETGWVDKGSYVGFAATSSTLVRDSNEQTLPDIAISNSIAVVAFEDDSGGVRATVTDLDSGVIFQYNTLISASGSYPRCEVINGKYFVFYDDGSNTLKARILNQTDRTTFDAAVTIATDLNGTAYYEVKPITLNVGSFGIIAYSDDSNTIKVKYLDNAGAVIGLSEGVAEPVTISEQAETCLDLIVDETNDLFYIAWHNTSNGLRVTSLTSALTTNLAITTIDNTTSPVVNTVTMVENTDGNIEFYYEINAAQTYNRIVKKNTLTLPSTVGTKADFKRGCGLATKAWLFDSVTYVGILHDSTFQATSFVANSSGLLISKIFPGTGGGVNAKNMVPSVAEDDSGIFYWASVTKTKLTSDAAGVFAKKGISQLKMNMNTITVRTAELGGVLHTSGGFIQMYNGEGIVEHGFHLYPENQSAAAATSGGSMVDGTYLYKIIYQWTDYKGQVHFSGQSIATSATVSGGGGSGKVTLTIPTLRVTAKSNVIVEAYRTVDTGSTIYYRVGTVDNDTTADTVAIVDTLADASITSLQILYTVGGIVSNIAPPAGEVIATYKNRIMWVSKEDEKTIFFSKEKSPGVPVEFNDTFTKVVSKANAIVRMAELDDKLIIWEANKIFAMTGSGPENTGLNNTFSPVELIASDVGISDADSLVLTPSGYMFMTSKGIYLLDRSLKTSYIGAPVEDHNSKDIKAAVLIQKNNQVRFITNDDLTLVYDYFFQQWSTFTNHAGNGATSWLGDFVYLRTDGQVYKETTGEYLDDLTKIVMKIVTAWIKVNGVSGFQRVYRGNIDGDFKSDHNLIIKAGYDYQAYFNDQYEFDFEDANSVQTFGDATPYGEGVYGGTSTGVYQFRFHQKKQKCQAIRYSFEDQPSQSGIGQSYSLASLQLLVGVKPTLNKMKAAISG